MQTIGLIAAMPQESDALLHRIQGWKRISLGAFSGYSFERAGQPYTLVTSGIGIRRASEAARKLIEINASRILISFGIAGAVEADLQIGDVILADAVCRLNRGVPGPLLPLAHWPQAAQEAGRQALANRGARLFTGTAVTTEGSQVNECQLENMLHPILEMETAGIAQVAAEKGIPLYSLRAISDGPLAPIPFDLGQMMDKDANLNVSNLLREIVRHPSLIFQFNRLIRNSRIAADNAAIALIAALGQTTF